MCHDDPDPAEEATAGDGHIDVTVDEDVRDRTRGILTQDDRAYLCGEKEIDGTTETQLRHRLRARVTNALMDFEYLHRCLDERDLRLIFKDISGPPWPAEEGRPGGADIYVGVENALAFLYLGIQDHSEVDFEQLLERGIQAGAGKKPRQNETQVLRPKATADISVEWSPAFTDPEKAVEKFREGEPVSDDELAAIIRHGDLEETDWQRLRELSRMYSEDWQPNTEQE